MSFSFSHLCKNENTIGAYDRRLHSRGTSIMNSNPTTTTATLMTNLNSLYAGDGLPDLLDLLDDLHSAASEGELPKFTTLNPEEVTSLLEELVFVAQETLRELHKQTNRTNVKSRTPSRMLRLVQPDQNQEKRQA